MRPPAAWLAGALAAAGAAVYAALRLRKRAPRQAEGELRTDVDPRAEALRRKLDESRTLEAEREEFEAREVPVDAAEPTSGLDERRREVHEAGRAAAEEMRRSTAGE